MVFQARSLVLLGLYIAVSFCDYFVD